MGIFRKIFLAIIFCLINLLLLIVFKENKGISSQWNKLHRSSSEFHEDNASSTNQRGGLREEMKPSAEESLMHQVGIIRDALLKVMRQELPTAKHPTCKGDRKEGEVEDLLCMQKPNYLADVKNPCWWNKTGYLRCLPYFHIFACEKCASSDLWDRVTSHPHVVRIDAVQHKEAMWWGRKRYGVYHYIKYEVSNLMEYTDIFKSVTSRIKRSLQKGGSEHKYLITGDGTPSDMVEFRGWPNITQNRGRELPHVLTPHLMKHLYPNTTKFIAILRNPIERLYSDYYYVCRGISPEGFHQSVLKSIDILSRCISTRGLRQCFFDDQVYHTLPVRLHLIDYTLYVTEWLKVFPRDRFLFIKMEDYRNDIEGTVEKCWDFLDLDLMKNGTMRGISQKHHKLVGKKKQQKGPMWQSTRNILAEIVRPSVHFLPQLLEDERFTWDFDAIPVVER